VAGVVGVGIWAWSVVRSDLSQRRASREFDEQARNAPPQQQPGVVPPSPLPGDLIGRLLIPRLHMQAMVREGTDSRTLDVALGHITGTSLPGAAGNVAIAGHRDTLFRCLRNISKEDQIVFQTTYGSYTYDVEDTKIVNPRDVTVLAPGPDSEITLVTCYPFNFVGPAPDRFVVRARLISSQAAARGRRIPKSPGAPSTVKKLLARRIRPRTSHPSWMSLDE
jgi:sortase A